MDSHRIARRLETSRQKKGLTLSFTDRQLSGHGYTGDKSFFTELTYGDSDAGISVTNDKALNFTAYWACITLLAGTLASLPFFLYERTGPKGKKHATEHPLYRLLHDDPNPEMDSFSYIETLMYHLVASNGNCYSYIDWSPDRLSIEALWLMNPVRTEKARDEKTGDIVYKYQTEKQGPLIIPAYHVWHIPGFGYDGLRGYTPLTYARNQIGLGLASEKLGSKIFSNGLTIGGFLEHPGRMGKDAQETFKKTIEEKYQGVDKAHKLLILEEGMKYNKNAIPPNDAQWLETRKFQRGEMASFFHIPPHMIGDLDRATFSNIEEQSLEFVTYTLRPWLVRWERSANRQLLTEAEKAKYFVKFQVDGLLRGDIESRFRAYAVARNWGWMSANDVLELEDRNGIGAQGDIYLAPSNMLPADEFEATIPKPAKPKPAAPAKTAP